METNQEQNLKASQNANHQNSEPERLGLVMLVNAKKMGLSFEELNEFRVQDFIDFTNVYTGKGMSKTKIADQNDIDRFYDAL